MCYAVLYYITLCYISYCTAVIILELHYYTIGLDVMVQFIITNFYKIMYKTRVVLSRAHTSAMAKILKNALFCNFKEQDKKFLDLPF